MSGLSRTVNSLQESQHEILVVPVPIPCPLVDIELFRLANVCFRALRSVMDIEAVELRQQVMEFTRVCVCVCVFCLWACKTQEEVSSLREQVSADSAVLIDLQKAMQEQSQDHSRASHSTPSSTPPPSLYLFASQFLWAWSSVAHFPGPPICLYSVFLSWHKCCVFSHEARACKTTF
jgi:hypothetical protein